MRNDENAKLLEYLPVIQSTIKTKLRGWPRHHHDDVESIALEKVWLALPSINPALPPEPFIRKITRNCIIDHVKSVKAEKPNFQLADDEKSYLDDHSDDAVLTFADELRRDPSKYLPTSLCRVFLALQQHPTPAAAAAAIGMKVESFYRLTHRLKQRILELYQSRSDEFKRIAA